MDSPSPNQLALSDVSSKNMEENPGPSLDPEYPPAPVEADQDREYGCKFCNKKFSNKQALGGHQNAHKVERAMEKNARELHENVHFGYFGGGSSSYPGMPAAAPYLGSYIRPHDFVDRSVFNFPYNEAPPPPPQQQQQQQQQQQHGIRIGYNARPGLPLAGYPYGPARPVPGFNNVYSGWGAPGPRNRPQFPGQGASYVQNQGLSFRFSNIGAGGSSSGPFYQDLSGFGAPRFRPGGNPGGGENMNETINNPGNDQQAEDNSGLDLSLKL